MAKAPEKMSALKTVFGDITSCGANFIVHQTNCQTSYAMGLAQTMFEKFPYAECYKDPIKRKQRRPGTAIIERSSRGALLDPAIVNLFGQDAPGKPKKGKGDSSGKNKGGRGGKDGKGTVGKKGAAEWTTATDAVLETPEQRLIWFDQGLEAFLRELVDYSRIMPSSDANPKAASSGEVRREVRRLGDTVPSPELTRKTDFCSSYPASYGPPDTNPAYPSSYGSSVVNSPPVAANDVSDPSAAASQKDASTGAAGDAPPQKGAKNGSAAEQKGKGKKKGSKQETIASQIVKKTREHIAAGEPEKLTVDKLSKKILGPGAGDKEQQPVNNGTKPANEKDADDASTRRITIAFPKYIGCDLAGGDWTKYEARLKRFAEDCKERLHPVVCEVTLYALEKICKGCGVSTDSRGGVAYGKTKEFYCHKCNRAYCGY